MAVGSTLRFALAILLSAPAVARAVDVGDGKLTLHGAGGWNYARTDENFYYADDDGDYETAMFDLALAARPADQLVITAQLGFEPDEVELEWAFAEWRRSDAARFRIGQVQQPLGNYAEMRFVGTARPFYELPTSVYGPSDIGAASYYGVGLTGDRELGDWRLGYDAYAGAITLDVFEPFEVLEPGADPAAPVELEEATMEGILGGRVSLTTPIGLVLRASAYGGDAQNEGDDEESARFVGGLSAFYVGEHLWLSVEGFGNVERGSEQQVSAYAEVAWFFNSWLQVAARYDFARTSLDDYDGSSPLLRHDEVAVGMNFWFSPELVVKLSAHHVEGTRFVAPGDGALSADGKTNLVFAGAQFAF
jgi:hypothetical protein